MAAINCQRAPTRAINVMTTRKPVSISRPLKSLRAPLPVTEVSRLMASPVAASAVRSWPSVVPRKLVGAAMLKTSASKARRANRAVPSLSVTRTPNPSQSRMSPTLVIRTLICISNTATVKDHPPALTSFLARLVSNTRLRTANVVVRHQ